MIKILNYASNSTDKIRQIKGLLENKIYKFVLVPYYHQIFLPNNQTITLPAWTDIYCLKTSPNSQYLNSGLKLIGGSMVHQRVSLNVAETEKMLNKFLN